MEPGYGFRSPLLPTSRRRPFIDDFVFGICYVVNRVHRASCTSLDQAYNQSANVWGEGKPQILIHDTGTHGGWIQQDNHPNSKHTRRLQQLCLPLASCFPALIKAIDEDEVDSRIQAVFKISVRKRSRGFSQSESSLTIGQCGFQRRKEYIATNTAEFRTYDNPFVHAVP